MRAWAEGDAAAGSAVYRIFRGRVRAKVASLAPPHRVDDLCQETWLEATRCRCSWRGPEVGAWLYGIARNVTLAHHRRTHNPEPGGSVGSAGSVDRQLEAMRAMRSLSNMADMKRRAVGYWSMGATSREIGARLGKSEEAARKVVARTIGELAEKVRPACARGSAEKPKCP